MQEPSFVPEIFRETGEGRNPFPENGPTSSRRKRQSSAKANAFIIPKNRHFLLRLLGQSPPSAVPDDFAKSPRKSGLRGVRQQTLETAAVLSNRWSRCTRKPPGRAA